MYNKAVDNYAHALEFVLDCYKTQKMCSKPVDTYLLQYNSFLANMRLTICVLKVLILVLLCLILFLIDKRFKKCMMKLLPKILLC